MRRFLFAAAAALLAGSASAQWQTTTTNCQFVLGTMQCTSTTPQQQQNQVNWGLINSYPNPGQAFSDAFQRGMERRRIEEQQRAMQEQQRLIAEQQRELEAQSQQMFRREESTSYETTPDPWAATSLSVEAGRMIAAGDCAGAKALALNAGDLNLAKQVMGLCGN